jgi:hypothetical protein
MNYRWLLFGLLYLFIGCELTPKQPFQPQLVVHCLLHTNENQVQARVNRSYKLEEDYQPIFPGVELQIAGPDGVVDFQYVAGDSYRTVQPVQINEQDTWFLQAVKLGFDTVQAKTVIAGGFEILSPLPGDTVSPRDSMVWTRSRGSKGYYLSFRRIDLQDTFYLDALIPNDSFDLSYDSLRVRIPNMLFLILVAPPPESAPKLCTLRVWALDTNYYDWVRGAAGGGSVRLNHLNGGLGVFGSAVERTVPVWVRADSGPARRTTNWDIQPFGYRHRN